MKAVRRIVAAAVLLIAGLVAPASRASAAPDPASVGVTAGSGSLLVAGTSTHFLPRGFNTIGMLYPREYANTLCSGMDAGTKSQLAAARAAMQDYTDQIMLGMKTHWRANAVRFQVSQGALAFEHDNGGSDPYTTAVLSTIHQARAMGLIVLVSVQTEFYGCTPHNADGSLVKLPDQHTVDAWGQLAPSLGNDKGVILEIFNEPNTQGACGSASWSQWASGCTDGVGKGMVPVGQAVREMASSNVLLFDGDNNGGRFNGFTPPQGIPANSAYAVHPYYFADGQAAWNTRYGDLQASGHTVVATEWNESASCHQPQDLAAQLVQNYLPAHNIGLFVHSWDAPGAKLVNDSYDPVDSIPSCPQVTGATLAFNEFWSQAGGGDPAPEVHVSSITKSGGKVDAATVALADNGTKSGSSQPRVAHSVTVLVQKADSGTATYVATMTLATGSPWTHGSFTLATVSGLAGKSVVAGLRRHAGVPGPVRRRQHTVRHGISGELMSGAFGARGDRTVSFETTSGW